MNADPPRLESLLEAMFPHDERGRLIGPAPLLHVLRTDDRVICRSHADMPEASADRLRAIAQAERGRPTQWAEAYAAYLSLAQRSASVTAVRAGPLFRCSGRLPAPPDCVSIGPENLGLLRRSLPEWVEDAEAGSLMAAAIVDGQAVAVCATVRSAEGVACAGVETAPAHRGRGHAARAVAAWASLVQAQGAQPFYATTFDNLPSQKVAWRLGLTLIGSEFSIYGDL